MKHQIKLTINGQAHDLSVRSNETLLETLRGQLSLFGAREGCGVSVCGACTVLVNGDPVSSCIQLTKLVDGQVIETIEGLAPDGDLHPLQEEWWHKAASQCSYCTPGFILAAKSILERQPDIDDQELYHQLNGNLCRCTGYTKIKEALSAARERMRAERHA